VTLARTEPRNTKTVAPEDRLLVSEDTAAAMCGVSKPTFRSWTAEGLIRPVDLPHGIRRRLYRREELERLAASFGGEA
jgi:hypothetical protein